LILLSHILFGLIICLILFSLLKIKGVNSPSKAFYLFTLFMMEFPDLDHLYSMKIQLKYLVPFTISDLFKWSLRTEVDPLHVLHFWIYPFMFLALLALPSKYLHGLRWWILATFLGWSIHLLLDGVVYFV
jgi:hypothetical protein